MFQKFLIVTSIGFWGLCPACGDEPVTYEEALGSDAPASSAEDIGVGEQDERREDPEDGTDSAPVIQTDSSSDSASATEDSEEMPSETAWDTGSGEITTEKGQDRDTASKDGPAGNGETCWVNVLGMVNIEGKCRSLLEPCLGGTYPLDIKGDCVLGQVCCIAVDQCNKHKLDIVTCREQPCPAFGAQVGCPDGGWCCLTDL